MNIMYKQFRWNIFTAKSTHITYLSRSTGTNVEKDKVPIQLPYSSKSNKVQGLKKNKNDWKLFTILDYKSLTSRKKTTKFYTHKENPRIFFFISNLCTRKKIKTIHQSY